MRWDLVNKVLKDLKEVIPYKEGIVWEDCHSTSYLGRYYHKKNKIVISDYITDEQDYMATVAHELIHAAGVYNHGLEFKEWMNKINALNLGYVVHTNAGKDNGIEEIRKIRRENREKRKKSSKRYLTWCKKCGHAWISMRKHQKLSRWKCARCGGSLGQKIWREGKENKITFSGNLG